MVIISINQTDDEDSDVDRLNRIMATVREYPGDDEVRLRVDTGDGVRKLKLPKTAEYCPDMHQLLAEIVGEANVMLE